MAIDTKRLLRIGQAKKQQQADWLEGINLQIAAAQSIQQLRQRVAAARYGLAVDMRRSSRYAQTSGHALDRLVISRSYYSMYHAMRAAAYMYYEGDDHQQHADLPQRIPDDFQNRLDWSNQLKSAREYRNQADYDPYPRTAAYWRGIAHVVATDSKNLLPIVRMYLRAKGCNV
jgi:uncharacterized protein (UPF0332 family)